MNFYYIHPQQNLRNEDFIPEQKKTKTNNKEKNKIQRERERY